MQLFINGQEADVTLENEKTIGDVLSSFEKTCEENNAAVTAIQVDGKNVTAEIFDEVAKAPLKKETTIHFDVVTREDILGSFKFLSEKFAELSQQMENIPAQLQMGKDAEAQKSIAVLADTVEHFCHTATLASLFPETISSIEIDGKKLMEFFSDFPPVLGEFEQALQSNDTVLIGDLAEYEICPRLSALAKALGESK